jgi:hypothetical protein
MDVTRATSEPLYRFVKFHDALNRRVKTTTAALVGTKRAIGEGKRASQRLSHLIERSGEPWGTKNHWADPGLEIADSVAFFAELAVVRADSAFEDFTTSIVGDWDRWLAFNHGPKAATDSADPIQADDLSRLLYPCRRFGFDVTTVSELAPVYNFFHALRNCIAHRNGRPSPALMEIHGTSIFSNAWKAFRARRKKSPPPPPPYDDERITVSPWQAIFFSGVCRVIATEVNAVFTKAVGADGLIFLAAYHSLTTAPISTISPLPRTPEGLINRYLMSGRGVRPDSTTEVIRFLKKLKIWPEYRQAFENLRPPVARTIEPERDGDK